MARAGELADVLVIELHPWLIKLRSTHKKRKLFNLVPEYDSDIRCPASQCTQDSRLGRSSFSPTCT